MFAKTLRILVNLRVLQWCFCLNFNDIYLDIKTLFEFLITDIYIVRDQQNRPQRKLKRSMFRKSLNFSLLSTKH